MSNMEANEAQLTQTVRLTDSSDRRHRFPSTPENRLESGTKWSGPFYFVHAADTQFGMIDEFVKKLTNPKWDEEIRLSGQLVEACNKMEPKPKFLVVCGDLVHAWPGEVEMKRQQVADFKRVFAQLDPDIPMVCVCGNHDIGNEPTIQTLAEYQADFGDDYYYFITNGVLFIVLNSQFYENRDHVADYAREQDQWLETLLRRCPEFSYSIVFEHIPWFLSHFEEEDEYFNIKRELRLDWLRKFHEAGVNKIFCGHYHRNAGGWYGHLELVVTSAVGAALGDDKSGARLVRCLEGSIEHKYYELSEMPQRVELK